MAAYTIKTAEDLASEILETYWHPGRFPVDPAKIAKSMGVAVYEGELPDGVSGVLQKKKGQDPIIILEERDPYKRRRFTCAHELGHFVIGLRNGTLDLNSDVNYVDFRDGRSSMGTHEEERDANRFAAALLMPSKAFKKMQKKLNDFELAKLFEVSLMALEIRKKIVDNYL